MLSSVLFPEPDVPWIETNSPSSIMSETPSSAVTLVAPIW
jgi:hypothetical protein